MGSEADFPDCIRGSLSSSWSGSSFLDDYDVGFEVDLFLVFMLNNLDMLLDFFFCFFEEYFYESTFDFVCFT